MQMDFDGIASLAPLALNTNRSSNPCADEEVQSGPTFRPTLSASSRSVYEKLWDEAPRPGGPSMDLHRNVAYAQMVRSVKEEKVSALDELTDILHDHCAICWAYQGLLRPRHGNKG